jgi:ABC-type nitrate/sulfonate/bicarbonate transport system substrate-binding protein
VRPIAGFVMLKTLRALGGVAVLALAGCGGITTPASSPAPASSATRTQASSAPSTSSQPPASGDLAKVKIAASQALAQAGLFIGIDRGYFRQQGIDLEVVPSNQLEAMVPLLANGALDGAVGGNVPGIFNAAARGTGLRIVAAGSIHSFGHSTALVVRKALMDSGQMKSYADLKGKNVASSSSVSIFTIALDRALHQAGLSMKDVNLVNLAFPEMIGAMSNGGVDVAYLVEPFATAAAEQSIAVRWKETADVIPGHVASMWVYSQQLTENRPQVGKAFMTALLRGVRDYDAAMFKNVDRQQVVSILTKYTTLKDPALYDKIVPDPVATSGALPLAQLQEDLDWYQANGSIQGKLDLSGLVDTQFTSYAVQPLGPYQGTV